MYCKLINSKIIHIVLVVSMIFVSFGSVFFVNTSTVKALNSNEVNCEIGTTKILKKTELGIEFKRAKKVKKVTEKKVEDKEISKVTKEETIEDKIKKSCDEYGVSYSLALAIARLETGWFKSYAYRVKNNPGGLCKNGTTMSFATIDIGVDRFVKNLKKNYIDCGLDTPKKIGKKYCPPNPKWAKMVESLMS